MLPLTIHGTFYVTSFLLYPIMFQCERIWFKYSIRSSSENLSYALSFFKLILMKENFLNDF